MRMTSVLWLALLLVGCASAPIEEPEPPPPPVRVSHGKELGKQFIQAALKEYRFVKDPEIVHVVNRVGKEILAAIGEDPARYHFLIVHQNQLNAFAIPGGYIFLFDGLLKKLDSIDALAGVMAHEIAHVQKNHFFKDAKKINAINLATMASIILAGLAGEGQGATGTIAIAANVSLQLKFSRENEEEADLFALQYLRETPYHPGGLATFFDTLSFYQRFTSGITPPYLSTHPGLGERRLMVNMLIKDLPEPVPPSKSEAVEWKRLNTILRADGTESIETLFPKSQESLSDADEANRFYSTGLFALKSGAMNEALKAYQAAIRLQPEESIYYADLAQVYMRMQQATQAKTAADKSIQLADKHAVPHLVLGMVMQIEGDHQSALGHLEIARERAPGDPIIYYQLARTYHALSKPVHEQFNLGRYHRLNLEPDLALAELQKGMGLTDKRSMLGRTIQDEIDEIRREGL